jgi:hypothetical protein
MGFSTDLPASQLMAEFVYQHNQEQRQIFQHVPNRRRIKSRPEFDDEVGDDEPRPMHIHIDPGELKQME